MVVCAFLCPLGPVVSRWPRLLRTSKCPMRLLRFFEELTQFFWAAQDQVVYVNVTTDLIHQAVASFGNQARIWATVILRHGTHRPMHRGRLIFGFRGRRNDQRNDSLGVRAKL